jgi:FtsP/CotA-like multicopper oxidase with cupredoxin domain
MNPLLPKEIALERAKRVDLVLAGGGAENYTINGTALCDWGREPLFVVGRGQPVTLGFVNHTAVVQAMRLGGHVARELHALDDGWDPYWRDVVIVPPGRTVHAAFVADNPGKWPIASATPECRAAGLCGWFQVG